MAWRGYLDELDEQTASLIIQMQREDVHHLMIEGKGKQRLSNLSDVELSDGELALQLSLQELDIQEPFNLEKEMDMAKIDDVLFDGGIDDENLTKLQIRTFYEKQNLAQQVSPFAAPQAESSRWAASRVYKTPVHYEESNECCVCSDRKPFYDVLKMPCGDEYCVGCISELFERAMTDETLYPPKCCRQVIPLQSIRPFLTPGLAAAFAEKSIEFDTTDRTYCWVSSCSSFIPQTRIAGGNIATCSRCSMTTCSDCKARAHWGDCPNDTATQQLLTAAAALGWQRCYQCHGVVELNHGCNHITQVPLAWIFPTLLTGFSCRCRAEFCYICGERWKTCNCPHWYEDHVFDRATVIADRQRDPRRRMFQPPGGALPPPPGQVLDARPRLENVRVPDRPVPAQNAQNAQAAQAAQTYNIRVQEIIQNLLENHECDHARWRWVRGPHECEVCNEETRHYIFECRQCALEVCWACRRNRL